MYHIKKDRRCQRSAALIGDAFDRLLDRKPFMEISVSDLQRESGVGRSTFYRLFDNIDDVVTYLVDENFKDIAADYTNESWRDFTRICLYRIIERGSRLINIMTDGRTDLIISPIRNIFSEIYKDESPEKKREASYSFAVFSGACISIIRTWAENGRHESIDELATMLEKYLDYEELTASHPRP